MNREDKQMIIIYALIIIIIILLVLLTKVITGSVEKPEPQDNGKVQPVDTNPYPTINAQCIFDTTLEQYAAATTPGCENGYTRYNMNVDLNGEILKVSVVYSDVTKVKTGLFINDKRVTGVEELHNVQFGIFDNKLFIHDKNNNEVNALAYNSKGKEVYNLKKILEKTEIKDLSTGDTNISSKTLDPNSFMYAEGTIDFNSSTNTCQNGEQSKGSHYRVTYKDETFNSPEFIELVKC